jgi:hypothetical protein
MPEEMQKRKLDKNNLEVSAIGFRCTGLNSAANENLRSPKENTSTQ